MNPLRIAVLVSLALTIAACGDSPAPTKESTALPYTRATVAPSPDASDKVILSLKGGKEVDYDLSGLESSGLVAASIFEPFEKNRRTFTGRLLYEVLADAGVDPSATVNVIALDDYSFKFSMPDLKASSVMLATREDDAVIPVERGGPVRIVVPDGQPLAEPNKTDSWVWSVREIEVLP